MTFIEALQPCSKGLTSAQIEQLACHYDHLERWNKVLNLTSIRQMDQIVDRHYCESLFLARHLELAPGETVVDVGSGAGFPGIPVAVVHQAVNVALVESHTRKSVFLREASRGIPNIEVFHIRIEAVKRHFDLLISRAVAWSDIEKTAPRICKRVALLAGEKDVDRILSDARFTWNIAVALPNAEHRVLLTGTLK